MHWKLLQHLSWRYLFLCRSINTINHIYFINKTQRAPNAGPKCILFYLEKQYLCNSFAKRETERRNGGNSVEESMSLM